MAAESADKGQVGANDPGPGPAAVEAASSPLLQRLVAVFLRPAREEKTAEQEKPPRLLP